MKQSCGSCVYFRLWFFSDSTESDASGECTWHEDSLPFSMRYANRERMSVRKDEGKECCCYEAASKEKVKQRSQTP